MEQQICKTSSSDVYRRRNHIRIVRGGVEYFALLEQLIAQARYSIHMQVYIFLGDNTGRKVAGWLSQAALRGVKVQLLIDGYASQSLPGDLIQDMRRSGVVLVRFEPLFKSKSFYFGRRLHHKLFVADGYAALVGGVNISDHYYGGYKGEQAWLDFALFVKGESAQELECICCEMWNNCPGITPVQPCSQALPVSHDVDGVSVRIRRNDWIHGKSQIWKSYADLLANARQDLIIACSYFLPGWTFRKLLTRAARNGVRVRVIVAGPSDVMIAKHAERYLYRWMLRSGIRIFEYQESILHAKVAVADGRLMTMGSYNINNISAYASIELNLDVRNKPFVTSVQQQLSHLIDENCLEITGGQYEGRYSWPMRLWQRCCYETIKIVLYLFTFYFNRERIINAP